MLLEMHQKLFNRIINVEMLGDLLEISQSFRVGEKYCFQIEQFSDSKDDNVQGLVGLYDRLEELMNILANVNGLTEEELEKIRQEDEEYEDKKEEFEQDEE